MLDWFVKNRNLAPLTTWRIGGRAQYYGVVTNGNMLLASIQAAKDQGLPLYILGSGSNLLVDDSGVPGVVIRLEGDFKKSQLVSPNRIKVGAGFRMPLLAKKMADAGFTGFEFMVGIPGTIGGGVVINAGKGVSGTCMSSILKSVCFIDDALQKNEESVETLEMAYRSSRLKHDRAIVISAEYILEGRDEPQAIQHHLDRILAERKGKFPWNYPNAGSVFKRPDGYPPVGLLIEKAGLKGRQVGNAQISPIHANFIVNLGWAKSADVKNLISLAQEEVFKVHGAILEREVIYWPEETSWKIW